MNLNGIIVPMVTPFDENGNVDCKVACDLAEKLIADGVHGLFLLGTNGEFYMMTNEEKKELVNAVVTRVNHRIPVYAGSGLNSTQETIKLSNEMKALGVDALSVITPSYAILTQEELYEYFKEVAAAVDLPLILYNIPKFTGNNLDPQTVAQLANIKNIVAVKDSSGNIENMRQYVELTKDKDFCVLDGSDGLILETLKMGVSGAIAGCANLIGKTVVDIYESYFDDNIDQAIQAQMDVDVLRKVIKLGTQPSVIKRAMVLSGIPVGEARKPIITPNVDEKIEEALMYFHIEKQYKCTNIRK